MYRRNSSLVNVIMVVFALSLMPVMAFASSGGGVETAPGLTERMMHLVIQIGVILFAARLGNMAFEKMRMPGVLGELCAGIVIGPSLLGGIGISWLPGFKDGLFHVAQAIRVEGITVSPELYGFCAVASVVLLFLVGIETDIKLFTRYAVAGTLVGLGGVIVSFFVGDLIGGWLLPLIQPGDYPFMHPARIFLGVMSTATSVSITARILSERKKLETPEGTTILAGAVLDDVLGIVILAIGMGVVGAEMANGVDGASAAVDWGNIGMIALKSIGVWLGATIFGVLVARHIGAGLKTLGGHNEIAIMALGLAMLVAGVFEEAHLAMIIGAYVMGLSLSRTDLNHVVREALQPIFTFLVPIFFTVMGMMVDVTKFLDSKILLFGVIYTILAILAKLIGCGIPALISGFNIRGAVRIGLGMIPRGEVALIVAGLGLASGCLSSEIFGVAVFMTLFTTIIPPPFMVWAFRSPKSGLRDSSKVAAESQPMIYKFPTRQMNQLMLAHLLDALRREGCFVHALDHGNRIYQVRKDAMVMGIRKEGEVLSFEIDESEVAFVQTAMREVVAEVESTLQALRHPLDPRDVLDAHNNRRQNTRSSDAGEKIARYLKPEMVKVGLKADTKLGIIEELLDLIVATGCVGDRAIALEAIMKRERVMSTGLTDGVASPHGRTTMPCVLACAVGVKPEGVDFESADGKPSQIFTLVLSDETSTSPYLEFMACISTVLDEKGRAAVLAAKTSGELYKAITAKRS